jgi:hypothetical protein
MIGPLARLLPYALSFVTSLSLMVLELVASRLVARHVGASLIVWTSVIGIILAGICLGNVLGGRLADRMEPRRALGPLYALGAALVVACLWINAYVASIPGMGLLPWDLRTVLIVSLDFLVPATVLGMVSPVVAKMAVVQAERAGGAIGDVYFLGAVGSIAGTFLAGFWLISIAPTSTIVAIVAASLALLAGVLANGVLPAALGLGGCVFLVLGALESIGGRLAGPGVMLGGLKVNAWGLAGHALTVAAAVSAWATRPAPRKAAEPAPGEPPAGPEERLRLGDLSTLAFVASLAFMALEMVAGRLVTRHLGSSVFSWTSVIGVLLGGLSLGNYLGGKLADRVRSEKAASHLFLVASVAVAGIIVAESPPHWLVRNPIGYFFRDEPAEPLSGGTEAFLRQATEMPGFPWWFCVLFWTGVVFFLPALTMGTVSPVVAKLAVDRSRRLGLTGSAIGQVYAWGMVGSLVGTFLTGFLLIDVLGTKGLILVLATSLAVAATALGSVWHAAWAGVPLGLCVIAFLPPALPAGKLRDFFSEQGRNWGLREPVADPDDPEAAYAYLDESNYYYIKVDNHRGPKGTVRTLVLDNLIHGYFVLGHPEVLDYDYEHIYAYVTDRVLRAKAKAEGKARPQDVELGTLFLGGGSYTFPRYLQATYPKTWAEIAEIDPAVTRANHAALGLPPFDRTFPRPRPDGEGNEVLDLKGQTYLLGPEGSPETGLAYFEALESFAPAYRKDERTGEGFAVIEGERREFGPFDAEASRDAYLAAIQDWYAHSKYVIRTTWGDARQYVVRHEGPKMDIIYGDAFNDFSVPWHLTTREFNDRLAGLLSPQGVYMINIIDQYESDEEAATSAPKDALSDRVTAAIGGLWRSERPKEEVAYDLWLAMLTVRPEGEAEAPEGEAEAEAAPEPSHDLAAELDDAAKDAVEALARDHRAMTRAELHRLIDAALPADAGADAGTLPPEPRLVRAAEAQLADERAGEVLDVIEDARASIRSRYQDQKNDTFAPVTIESNLKAVLKAGQAEGTAEARMTAIDDALGRCIEAAESLAGSDPRDLPQALESIRGQARDAYDPDARPDVLHRVLAVFDLLDSVRQAAEQEAQALPKGVDPVLANQKACRMAGEVGRALAGVRTVAKDRFAAIRRNAQGDPAAAGAAVRAYLAYVTSRAAWVDSITDSVARARGRGAFLGSWVNTAKKTFPHVYVFGTAANRGSGGRETFVVVASRAPLDLADLGRRPGEPKFTIKGEPDEPDPYGPEDLKAIEIRSRGIVLTDDYAPVENLLAPVAETRASGN